MIKSASMLDMLKSGLKEIKNDSGFRNAVDLGLKELGVKWYWPKKAKETIKLLFEYYVEKL